MESEETYPLTDIRYAISLADYLQGLAAHGSATVMAASLLVAEAPRIDFDPITGRLSWMAIRRINKVLGLR